MLWVLLWVLLLLGAALVLGLLGRTLWRKAKALTAEVTEASERLAAVAASLSELSEQAAYPRPDNQPATTAGTTTRAGARSRPRQRRRRPH